MTTPKNMLLIKRWCERTNNTIPNDHNDKQYSTNILQNATQEYKYWTKGIPQNFSNTYNRIGQGNNNSFRVIYYWPTCQLFLFGEETLTDDDTNGG
jgi:hypothetical protein